MSEAPEGRVYTERHDHILKIMIANAAKKNAFSPEMMAQLSDALTLLENDDALWVGVLCAEGSAFTAGLDMPKFFGPTATVKPDPEGNIDPFGLANQCSKPIVTAVQGICYTIGIELMLSGDIVIAANDARFCQMEAKRGIAPLGGAHFRYTARAGWATRCTTSCYAMNSARQRPTASGWCRKWWNPAPRLIAQWNLPGSSPPTHRSASA